VAHLIPGMKVTRYRSAWIWFAVAVVAVATVARAEAGAANSASYAHPVFEFLSGHSNSSALATHRVPRLPKAWSARRSNDAGASLMQAMLPVLFVGLITSVRSPALRSNFSTDRLQSSPLLAFLFQRPPPVLAA
jgi:hypothetical protein